MNLLLGGTLGFRAGAEHPACPHDTRIPELPEVDGTEGHA